MRHRVGELTAPAVSGPGVSPASWRRTAAILAAVVTGCTQIPAAVAAERDGPGLLAFELSGTTRRADIALDTWSAQTASLVRYSLLLDMVFVLAWAAILWRLTLSAADAATAARRPRWAAVGRGLAVAVLVAAVLDLVQNGALAVIAGGHTEQPYPAIGFATAIVVIPTVLGSLIYGAATQMTRTRYWRSEWRTRP